ncbi:hypothetical protein HZS_3088, partial [Henneguya salminicola]
MKNLFGTYRLLIKMLSQLVKFNRFYNDSTAQLKIFSMLEGKIELPKLPYSYKDLEPIISEEIMRIHHLKHHQNYINKYLEARKAYEAEHSINSIEQLLRKANFNGGGVVNHSLFWKFLVPPTKAHEPTHELADMIKRDFCSTEKLLQNIKTLSADLQGSGWIWIAYNQATDSLSLETTTNQDILQINTGLIPILGIDLWEH